MQFHVEIDRQKIEAWLGATGTSDGREQQKYPTVHGPRMIRETTSRFLPAQQALAERIYTRWLLATS
jgi:hypothetical protein